MSEPFGALLYTTSFGRQPSRQGFIDKENDRESGLGDFGVRKYECETGRFLSVNVLWEMTPQLTPCHYGANMPMKLIESSGEYVEVSGVDADQAVAILNYDGSLVHTRDTATGRPSAVSKTGATLTSAEQAMMEAINDPNVTVQLTTTRDDWAYGSPFVVGAFGGSVATPQGTVALQTMNLDHARSINRQSVASIAEDIHHEVTEAFFGGRDSPGALGTDAQAYEAAHSKANALGRRIPWAIQRSVGAYTFRVSIVPVAPFQFSPFVLYAYNVFSVPYVKIR